MEEILKMEAGRGLDAAVAYYVMEADADSPADSALIEGAEHYSTDISTAYQVVEKMFKLGFDLSLLHHSSGVPGDEGYWYCDFRPAGTTMPPKCFWVDHQKDAPEAICRAALLVKIAEVG